MALTLVALTLLGQGARAANEQSFTALDAHTHGAATLTVIVSAQQVAIGFQSPAFNLLGFESAPQTEEQRAALARVESKLEAPSTLLSFLDADCEILDRQVSRSDEAHDDHDHADEHEHGEHWEFMVNILLHCAALAQPPSLEVNVFQHFPGIAKIELLWATDTRQGASALDSLNHTATLQ